MNQVIVSLLMLTGVAGVAASSLHSFTVAIADPTGPQYQAVSPIVVPFTRSHVATDDPSPAAIAPLSVLLAQMSRDEHQRLRLELRRGSDPSQVAEQLDRLMSPSHLRSGLTFQERRKLREQLSELGRGESMRTVSPSAPIHPILTRIPTPPRFDLAEPSDLPIDDKQTADSALAGTDPLAQGAR